MIERPDYTAGFELDGPHPDPIVVPWWVLPILFLIVCVVAGALASHAGWL